MRRIALALALSALVASAAIGVAAASTQATAKKVTVDMTEYKFKLIGAKGIKHGVPVVFKVVNKGKLLHNFDIQGVKSSKVIGPGKTTTIRVTFKKAGKYPYLCDVPRHAELGMAGTLTVK